MPFLRVSTEVHAALELLSLLRGEHKSEIASEILRRDWGQARPLTLAGETRLRIDDEAGEILRLEAEKKRLRMRPLAEAKLAKGTIQLLMEQVEGAEELEEWKAQLVARVGTELEPLIEESWRLRSVLLSLGPLAPIGSD